MHFVEEHNKNSKPTFVFANKSLVLDLFPAKVMANYFDTIHLYKYLQFL